MGKILVVGSLNMDTTIALMHMPKVGETILADAQRFNVGGKGANQAGAVGKLGGDVSILGAVGDDEDGQILIENMQKAGVAVDGICIKKGENTGRAIIYVNEEGDNSIVVLQGANALLSVEDIRANTDKIMESDIVMLQMEIPIQTIEYVIKAAAEAGKKVILDPAPASGDFPKELYPYIDVIKPNETELGILLNNPDAVENIDVSARQLRDYGVKNVVATLGEQGTYIISKECGQKIIPAYTTNMVDSTAAGDSFIAALAVRLSNGADLESAVDYGNFVASIVVSREGAQSSIPTNEEVAELYAGRPRRQL